MTARRVVSMDGLYLTSCPDYLRKSPAILDAWQYYRWSEAGELGLYFPRGVPLIVLRTVDALRLGYSAGQIHKMQEGMK